jgi:tRNA (guanine37-N1)-methyltransferase
VRIDIVTIFPEYFAPLDLSLIGKAREKGLIDIRLHDLRSWTQDVHKTVDDTPYGGGAGMVMMAEPWGRALDEVLTPTSTLVIPTPSGSLFHQDTAKEWSTIEHLVFACGRYEGIDQRVIDHYSQSHDVRCVSMGDYVLNGGEVAVLAMVEAVGRLIPGVVGNPESLVEESHEDGFLEYPVYTKPATWRGLAVPDVLLSGHHGEIRSWRAEQAKKRTQETRPDLLGGGD